jgi:peptidoglycan/LPS O-acetylase OafA/YrhL
MTQEARASSRQVTEYLRGIAILTVVVNHFLNEYVTHSLGGYANGMMSVFFILSGYGIFFSLSRESKKNSLTQLVVTFWRRRMVRIYPLFWIYCLLEYNFRVTLVQLLAWDFMRPAVPWFIPAILQCYLVAPLFFLLINRLGVKRFSIMLGAGFVVLNLVLFSLGVPNVPSIAYHGYHGMFFSHLLLFGAGVIIARLASTRPKTLSPLRVCVMTVLFICFLHAPTPQANIHFSGSKTVLEVFFLLFSIVCVYSFLNSTVYLPGARVFQGLGVYSYSIFLFHRYYFKGLEKIGMLEPYNVSLAGMLISVMLLPVFLAGIAYGEEVVNGLVNRNFDFKATTQKYCAHIFLKKTR